MQLGRPLDVKQHELETEPVCELARDPQGVACAFGVVDAANEKPNLALAYPYGTVRKRARAPIAPHTEATWSEHAAASPKTDREAEVQVEMRRALLIGLPLIVGGVIVVALPDSGPRLFSLSRRHGPSFVDASGIALLLAGWLVIVVAVR